MMISEEVLVVLSAVECTGSNAVISGQLDRKLYAKVNDVLVALGGKWNRSAKAHVFAGDAAERIDEAILMGEVETHKDIGFFPTPQHIAQQLVHWAKVEPHMVCLEPSAGTGNIARELIAVGAKVLMVERDDKMSEALAHEFGPQALLLIDDFMQCAHLRMPTIDRVVMNAPFVKGAHLDHTQLAYRLLRAGGIQVSVLPSSVLFREDKRHVAFRAWVKAIGGIITKLPVKTFRASGTDVETCVLYVEKRQATRTPRRLV